LKDTALKNTEFGQYESDRSRLSHALVDSARVQRNHEVLVISQGVGDLITPLIPRAGRIHFWGGRREIESEMGIFDHKWVSPMVCEPLLIDCKIQPDICGRFDRILFLQEIDCTQPCDYLHKFIEFVKPAGRIYAILHDRYPFDDKSIPNAARIERNAIQHRFWRHLVVAAAQLP
jgi:hypothetical protein